MDTQTILNVLYVGLVALVFFVLFFIILAIFLLYRIMYVLRRVQRAVDNAQYIAQSVGLLRNKFKLGIFTLIDSIITAVFGKRGEKYDG